MSLITQDTFTNDLKLILENLNVHHSYIVWGISCKLINNLLSKHFKPK